MANTRIPREVSDRQQSERPKQWRPPELLPEPDKQPGFEYRWIRVSLLNSADPRNISSKIREGYEPVRAEEQPKFKLLVDPNSRYPENIEIGGLLLCRIPTEFLVQRAEYYGKQNQAQVDSVDNQFMRESDPRMPLFRQRESRVSFGSGS